MHDILTTQLEINKVCARWVQMEVLISKRNERHEVSVMTFQSDRGRIAQSVTCLATDARLTADRGVVSSITALSHTFVEIDHEIISTVIFLTSLNHSRRVVVSYKRKYVHEVLVNCLFKLAQEKVWLGELTFLQ